MAVRSRVSWLAPALTILWLGVPAHSGDTPRTSLANRTRDDIVKTLAQLAELPKDAGKDPLARERLAALRRLMAYRYLAGVPYQSLELDEGYNKLAQAAAVLCEKMGKLDHEPKKNPGLPEEDFKLGVQGCNSCNLGFGHKRLADTIDSYLADSEAGNIAELGHRRWCISPRMQKTGLGRAGMFTAMYCFDRGQQKVPPFEWIAFPPPGPMPLAFFQADWPWNVSVNLEKYKEPSEKKIKVQVSELGVKDAKTPCKLSFQGVNNDPYGVPACIIFRPELKELKDGQRFLVEIEGLEAAKGKAPPPLRYVVEFFKL